MQLSYQPVPLKQSTLASIGYRNVINALNQEFGTDYSILLESQYDNDDFELAIELKDGRQFSVIIGRTEPISERGMGPGGYYGAIVYGQKWDEDPLSPLHLLGSQVSSPLSTQVGESNSSLMMKMVGLAAVKKGTKFTGKLISKSIVSGMTGGVK